MFQQLAGAAARAIHRRVRALVDGDLTPEALAAVPDEALRAAGLSAAKLASLRDLSAKVLDGTVVLDARRIDRRRDHRRPDAVRGIGRWTAEMYLMFELRRLDVWPVDDLGVRQGYGLAWRLDPPPTPKLLIPLGERFRPYRSVVARYCWEAVVLFRGADPACGRRWSASAAWRTEDQMTTETTPADDVFAGIKIIDVDTHLSEPADLWTSRAPAPLPGPGAPPAGDQRPHALDRRRRHRPRRHGCVERDRPRRLRRCTASAG